MLKERTKKTDYRFNKFRITCDDPSKYYPGFIKLQKELNITTYLYGNLEKGTQTEKPHFHGWFLTPVKLKFHTIIKNFKKFVVDGGNQIFSMPNLYTNKAKKLFHNKNWQERLNLLSYPLKENLKLTKKMYYSNNIEISELINYRKELEKNKKCKNLQTKSDSIIAVIYKLIQKDYPNIPGVKHDLYEMEQDIIKEIFRYYRIRKKVIGTNDYLKRVKQTIQNKYKIYYEDELFNLQFAELSYYKKNDNIKPVKQLELSKNQTFNNKVDKISHKMYFN